MFVRRKSFFIFHFSFFISGVIALAMTLAAVSCGQRPDISKLASAEAAEAAMKSANDAQRKGDYARASDIFQAVTIAQPANALAHLQAAVILQDRLRDDATAIFHLNAFLRLEPGSEKAAMAAERLGLAKRRLTVNGSGETTTVNPPRISGADNAAASDAIANANAEIDGLLARMRKLDDENTRLRAENTRLKNYIEFSGDESSATPPSGLDEFRARQNQNPPAQPQHNPAPETKYRTVEVRHGETIWSIAQDYLYDGSRAPEIRAANPGLIGADGAIKPGMIINLPLK